MELLGLDVFDPVTMDVTHGAGDDVPAWFLDTDYNGMCFPRFAGLLFRAQRIGRS